MAQKKRCADNDLGPVWPRPLSCLSFSSIFCLFFLLFAASNFCPILPKTTQFPVKSLNFLTVLEAQRCYILPTMPRVDLYRLEKAARFSAMLVSELGEDYWPLFERLEEELRIQQEREKKLEKFQ